MRRRSLAGLVAVLLAVGLLGVAERASARPAPGRPAAGPRPAAAPNAVAPPAGSALEPGEFYPAPFEPGVTGWRVTGRGDGQTANWTITFDETAARDCIGSTDQFPGMIGIMQRDGQGPFGGHVLKVRFFGFSNGYVKLRDLTGEAVVACFRTINPAIPDGTAFTITTSKLFQWGPAGASAADGHLDLVTASNDFGYMVARNLPGRGWQPAASIGGNGFEPSVLRLPNGGLRIFIIGQPNPALYTADISPDRRFLGWRSWGGARLIGTPYPVLMPDHSINAYLTGQDRRVKQVSWAPNGTFRGWGDLGVPGGPGLISGASGPPAAASIGGGNVTVAVSRGSALSTRTYTKGRGWGGWTELPDPWTVASEGPLAAVSPGAGVIDVFWVSAFSNSFLHVFTRRARGGHWGGLVDLRGGGASLFASIRAGRTDLWLEGTDSHMYQRTFSGGRWSAWLRLPFG